DSVHQADGVTVRRASSDFRRAENGSGFRDVGEGPATPREVCTRRRATNTTRVKRLQRRHVAANKTTQSTVAENSRTGDKERSPFLEEHLERREVYNSRIDFDLTEVRIDGCVEREIWS